MKKLESKILGNPDLTIIYRLYIKPGQDMSYLHEISGMALNIQIAYYLSTKTVVERNQIVKDLL